MLMSPSGAHRDPAPALAWGLHFLFPFSQEGALSCLAAAISEFAKVKASQPAYPRPSVISLRHSCILQTLIKCLVYIRCIVCVVPAYKRSRGGTIPGAWCAVVNKADRSSHVSS